MNKHPQQLDDVLLLSVCHQNPHRICSDPVVLEAGR